MNLPQGAAGWECTTPMRWEGVSFHPRSLFFLSCFVLMYRVCVAPLTGPFYCHHSPSPGLLTAASSTPFRRSGHCTWAPRTPSSRPTTDASKTSSRTSLRSKTWVWLSHSHVSRISSFIIMGCCYSWSPIFTDDQYKNSFFMMSLFLLNKKNPKTFNIFFICFQIICLTPVTDPPNKFQNNVSCRESAVYLLSRSVL